MPKKLPQYAPPPLVHKGEERPRLGRPPAANGTTRGVSRMRFDAPDDLARKIRERHAEAFTESGIVEGPWPLRQVCKALGLQPPAPKKRGPKSK